MADLIRAVLFDLDGVLVESRKWHIEAFQRALDQYGCSLSDSLHSQLDGLPTSKKLEHLLKVGRIRSADREAIEILKQRETVLIINERCTPDLTKTRLLDSLQSKSVLVGVCTNAIRPTLDLILQRMEISRYFDCSFSSTDVHHPKPDPEIYLNAISALNVSRSETLIVEDSNVGVEAARASGAHVLIVEGASAVDSEKVWAQIRSIAEPTKVAAIDSGTRKSNRIKSKGKFGT